MEQKICPYPGLRPFTEEESIFFKGRDLHVLQIIKQLEEKKVLMLTGASGDGKSSLVYAGVIPNARAGFFKAKHNNWKIADFRPERSPLHNLTTAICMHLDLDYEHAYGELQQGFSALVDLYKSTDYYLDKTSEKWENAKPEARKKMQQKASNLFILADQFEEFFTNTENFSNSRPSLEAYTTVNLLLETARIAKDHELPIYVVCTMRSDYISQSVSFKGLPEAIGYSQFFVPRLKRNELQQVIEEPAILSGGKISKRLSEILINELREGFDQLPVLQHTLNRLWKEAENGNQEMDLIHLAKIAGLPTKYLTGDDKDNFDNWFEKLSESEKKYYQSPSLTNVLNTHANLLYDQSFSYFINEVDWAEKQIEKEDAELILKAVFQSLTKIDGGRAVRNRMSLREITNIINKEHISIDVVCGVLNIFRLPDSTFIHPFIEENILSSKYLAPDTVLDITHEALIRNWKKLEIWDEEERDNLNSLDEFSIQLNRWIKNDRSREYLLAIGTLSHFKGWFDSCLPNEYWIVKYDDSSKSYEKKLEIGEKLVSDSNVFLIESQKRIAYLERRKKRARRWLGLAASLIIVILLGFTYSAMQAKNYLEQQKELIEKEKDNAEAQRNIALEANEKTEEQRLIAEAKAREAWLLKLEADSAKSDAIKSSEKAEYNAILANKSAAEALLEKQKADKLRLVAENERQAADKERKKAELASGIAKKLNMLALAQTLAQKAKIKYKSKQLSLLLAYQAYKFNRDYKGAKNDPAIHEAFRIALKNEGIENTLKLEQKNILAFQFIDKKKLLFVNEKGELFEAGFPNKKVKLLVKLSKRNTLVDKVFFLTENVILLSFLDLSSRLYDINKKSFVEIKGYEGLLRGASLSLDQKTLVTAGRDHSVRVWDLSDKVVEKNSIHFDERVTAVKLLKSNNLVYASTDDGNILSWDYSQNRRTVLTKVDAHVNVLEISPDESTLLAGYSNGLIRFFDLKNNNKQTDLYVNSSGFSALVFNPQKRQQFAVACNDKHVKIYELKSLNSNPIDIYEHDQKLNYLSFTQENKLFGLSGSSDFWFWETETEKYAQQILNMLIRNLTQEEWEKYIGNHQSLYQKTINLD